MKPIQIPKSTAHTRTIEGTLFSPDHLSNDRKSPAVLLIHGWTSAQDRMFDVAKMLSEQCGMACLTIDLTGHGKSLGDRNAISRKDFLDDVIAAYDFLAQIPHVDATRIRVVGSSFGAHLGALLSAERSIEWMVLRVPADYPDNEFDLPRLRSAGEPGVEEWRLAPREWNETKALRAVHSFSGKILIVESGKDTVVPHQTIVNYMRAASKQNATHVVMETALHSITDYPELKKEFNDIVYDWLKKV
jgi:esterase/lipase